MSAQLAREKPTGRRWASRVQARRRKNRPLGEVDAARADRGTGGGGGEAETRFTDRPPAVLLASPVDAAPGSAFFLSTSRDDRIAMPL
jgi:hypothetical protein